MKIKSPVLGVLLAISVALPVLGQPAPPPSGGQAYNPTPTFYDNFRAGQLDRTKWQFGGGQVNGQQAYVPDAYQFTAKGLKIRADVRTFAGQPYTSGEITTQGCFSQTYGYYEMRAKLPKGKGFWPAFWLVCENNNWPPEIDTIEYLGNDPFTYYTTLWYGSSSNPQNPGQTNPVTQDLAAGYHIYSVSWLPGDLVYYIDGVKAFEITGSNVPSQPMYMIANLAVGGGWPGTPDAYTVFPNYMNVDYIAAFQYTGITSRLHFPSIWGPPR